jgi:hypothetical protein
MSTFTRKNHLILGAALVICLPLLTGCEGAGKAAEEEVVSHVAAERASDVAAKLAAERAVVEHRESSWDRLLEGADHVHQGYELGVKIKKHFDGQRTNDDRGQ